MSAIEKIWEKVGGGYLLMDRGYRYVNIANFSMLIYVSFIKDGGNLLWPVLLSSIAFCITVFDYFYIYPKHTERQWKKNPAYNKILERLDEIEEKIYKQQK